LALRARPIIHRFRDTASCHISVFRLTTFYEMPLFWVTLIEFVDVLYKRVFRGADTRRKDFVSNSLRRFDTVDLRQSEPCDRRVKVTQRHKLHSHRFAVGHLHSKQC